MSKTNYIATPWMDRLEKAHVLEVTWDDRNRRFVLHEANDLYHYRELSPAEMIELGGELIALANEKMH